LAFGPTRLMSNAEPGEPGNLIPSGPPPAASQVPR
jgi:hypothetical protein